jgi:endonuclease YncB( thermonuclease family)
MGSRNGPSTTFASEPETASNEGATEAAAIEWRTVARVIDGDTIVLDGGERVRLIVHAGSLPLGASPVAPPHELPITQHASGTSPLREYNPGAPAP